MNPAITRIGFSTGNVEGDLNKLDHRLTLISNMGSTLAELTGSGLDVVSDCRLMKERVTKLKDVLNRYDLEYTLHAPNAINLLDTDHYKLHHRAAVVTLDLAVSIGAGIVVMHPGRAPKQLWDEQEQKLLEQEARVMEEIGKDAAARGVLLTFENLNPDRRYLSGEAVSYALDPGMLAFLLDEVNQASVAACLDISHAQQGTMLLGLDIEKSVAALAPHVKHVHYSDSTGIPSSIVWNNDGERLFMGIGDMHAPPGWGRVDFALIAGLLAEHRQNKEDGISIAIELKKNHFQNRAEFTLERARTFGRQIQNRNRV